MTNLKNEADATTETDRTVGGLHVTHRGYCDQNHADSAPCNTSGGARAARVAWRASMGEPPMTSETVQTIARQINSIRGMHPSMRLIAIDETTLRVHTKRGRIVRNVDISYDGGLDLYNVAVHTFSAPGYEVTTEVTEGVYVDSLENFFPERVVLHS